MPRRARITLPNIPHHIIQRGNNRQACFFCEQDYQFYLTWLEEYAKEFHCLIHAYVLMTNHVHLLITPLKSKSLGQLMKCLGQRYVQYICSAQLNQDTFLKELCSYSTGDRSSLAV